MMELIDHFCDKHLCNDPKEFHKSIANVTNNQTSEDRNTTRKPWHNNSEKNVVPGTVMATTVLMLFFLMIVHYGAVDGGVTGGIFQFGIAVLCSKNAKEPKKHIYENFLIRLLPVNEEPFMGRMKKTRIFAMGT